MRFYLDENLSDRIAIEGRRRGLDITSSHEVGNDHLDDEAQLLYAAGEGRCLVTADGKDFWPLTNRFQEQGLPHAGLICLPRPSSRNGIGGLLLQLEALERQFSEGMPAYLVIYAR